MAVDADGLRSVVRRLHVHLEVVPDLELRDGERVRVGTIARLWGVHARGARALPGCSQCHDILAELERLLAYVLDHETTMRVEVEPFRRALYESRVVPDADEVALAFRVSTGGVAEERWLKALRARLRELGVTER